MGTQPQGAIAVADMDVRCATAIFANNRQVHDLLSSIPRTSGSSVLHDNTGTLRTFTKGVKTIRYLLLMLLRLLRPKNQ